MSTTLWRAEIGTEGYAPGTVLLNTTDDFASITTAGYLNNAGAASSVQIRPTDFIMANYAGGNAIFTVSINASGVITMVDSSVTTPVSVPNGGTGDTSLTAYAVLCGGTTSTSHVQSIASVGTAGQVLTSNGAGALPTMQATSLTGAVLLSPSGDQNITAHNLSLAQGSLTAGSSGHAGTLKSFPATGSKGSLQIAAVANTGDTITTLSNDAMGQASTVNIPDPANAVGQLLIAATATPFVSGNLPQASGTTGLMTDSGISAADVVVDADLLGYTKIVNSVALTNANLAAAATVTVLPAASGTSQVQLTNIFLNGVTGTDFSGGGGDRNLHLTDGVTEFTLIPAATLQALTNSGWGSVAVPYPAIVAINQASAAGAIIYAEYANGSADYTAGSVTVTLEYAQVTA